MEMKNMLLTGVLTSLCLTSAFSQTARVQVIHNSADAAAAAVDVWLTAGAAPATRIVDDFAFRTATPFVDLPAGVALQIGIAPGNSMMVTDTIANFNLTLTAGEKYVVVANGIVSPTGYSPAPAFGLDIYGMGQESGTNASNTDLLVCHGSTDAPVVDVVEVAAGAGTLIDNFEYQEFTGYLSLPTADYSLQIRTGEGNTTVAQFGAPLSTLSLQGAAAVVVASGFLDPAQNSSGPAFGLYVALPTGGALVQLPSESISTARVQVIHNCADAAAGTVDIWLNDALLLDDFAFRSASPFVDAPAGTAFDVTVQPANSTDTTNGLARFTYTLTGGEKYILTASGIVSPSGYTPVQPFDILVQSGARELATDPANVDVLVLHGATDAPAVNVNETGIPAGNLISNLAYASYAGYLPLAELDYELEIAVAATNTPVVTYAAPLQTLNLGGQAITVLASGFLDPSQNSSGAPFGLYVALASGGNLIPLSIATSTEDALAAGSLTVFPNPATGAAYLQLPASYNGNAEVIIRDMKGAELSRMDVSGLQTLRLPVENLEAGMYLIETRDMQGQRAATRISIMK